MSIYNILFGKNKHSTILLAALGYTEEDCGRFRDCYIDGDSIVIYTRNGGGNREDYQYVFNKMSRHPCYISDSDDEYGCTYANIKFSFPEAYKTELLALAKQEPSITPSEKWQNFLNYLEKARDSRKK